MVLSQYLSKQLRSWYVQYLRSGRLRKRNYDLLPLSELLSEGQKGSKEMRILYLDSEVVHGT